MSRHQDQSQLLSIVRNAVLYVVLAKHDNEQSDLLHRVAEERLLEDLPEYQEILAKFTTKELISQADFSTSYEAVLREGAGATEVTSSPPPPPPLPLLLLFPSSSSSPLLRCLPRRRRARSGGRT